MKTKDLIYISMFAIILAICSWISIPMVVPFTLEIFGVFMAVLVLGGRRGTIAVAIYILLGMIGIPVFSGFRGGIAVLLGNTGGYIIGFIFMALVMWAMEKWSVRNKWMQLVSMLAALLSCYICGTLWFFLVYTQNTGDIGLVAVLTLCVFPYLIPDLLKLGLAYILSKRIRMVVRVK